MAFDLPCCLFLQRMMDIMNMTTTKTPRTAPADAQKVTLKLWFFTEVEIAACCGTELVLVRSGTGLAEASFSCFPANQTKIEHIWFSP